MATLKVPVTQHDHIRGPVNAPVTLVEYGDYECPYCGLAHPIVNAVRERFPRQLRVVFRHFPLSPAHPPAEAAAETAEFAGAHGRTATGHGPAGGFGQRSVDRHGMCSRSAAAPARRSREGGP